MCSFRGLGFSSSLLSAPQTFPPPGESSLWGKLSPEATDEGIRGSGTERASSDARMGFSPWEKLARRSRD